MNPLLIAALAFAPGIFWLWFFYKKDKYEPEPKRLIIQTFFFGMLSVLPAFLFELAGGSWLKREDVFGLAVNTFLVIGVSEELFKFLAVYLWAYRKKDFNEVADGIVYAASSSLGFASLENFFYIYDMPALILVRAPLSTLGHVLFSVFWGYPLGLVKMKKRRTEAIWVGLGLAALLHGFYDFLLMSGNVLLIALVIPLIVMLYIFVRNDMRRSLASSPFRFRCRNCGFVNIEESSFCSECGEKLDLKK